MKKLATEVIDFKDVRGNQLYYLRLTNKHEKEYLINIGKKSHDTIQKLLEEELIEETKKEIENENTINKTKTK